MGALNSCSWLLVTCSSPRVGTGAALALKTGLRGQANESCTGRSWSCCQGLAERIWRGPGPEGWLECTGRILAGSVSAACVHTQLRSSSGSLATRIGRKAGALRSQDELGTAYFTHVSQCMLTHNSTHTHICLGTCLHKAKHIHKQCTPMFTHGTEWQLRQILLISFCSPCYLLFPAMPCVLCVKEETPDNPGHVYARDITWHGPRETGTTLGSKNEKSGPSVVAH